MAGAGVRRDDGATRCCTTGSRRPAPSRRRSPSTADGAGDGTRHGSVGHLRRGSPERVGSGAVSGYPRPQQRRRDPARGISRRSAGAPAAVTTPATATGCRGHRRDHDSTEVQPGRPLRRALPGARRHGAEFAAAAVAAGAVAILTDAAGAALVPAAAVPVLVVDDPRAVLGDRRRRRLRRPDRAAAGHRHHRHGRQDLDRVPGRVGAARGRPCHRHDRHGRDPDRRRWSSTACAPRPRRPTCTRCSRPRCERGVDRGGDGGVQPRAGLRPGRRGAVRRSAASPTSAWTTSTSTPTWTTTSRPRRGSSTAGAGSRCSTSTTRRCAGWCRPGRLTLLGRRRPGARPGARTTSPPTASRSGSPRSARTASRSRPAWPCPGGTTSPTRCSRIAVPGRGRASTRRSRRTASRACRGVPGRLELVDAPGPGARRGRLRAQAGRDRGRAGRAARALGRAAG